MEENLPEKKKPKRNTGLSKSAIPLRERDGVEDMRLRFFKVFDYLVEKGKIKSAYEFMKIFKLNPGTFHRLRNVENLAIPAIYMSYLVKEYRVSAHWLLTGDGEMINP